MGTIEKKKIFILHGWTKNTDKWKRFIDYLKEDHFEIVLLKIPGLTDKIDGPWTLDNYVEWLKKIVDKAKSKVILIGHSNGGRIALAFTAKYQNQVSNIILIDAAGIQNHRTPLTIKRLVFKTIAKVGKKITSSERLKNILYKLAREDDYRASGQIMQKTMINLISANLLPVLPKINIPTVIIWGSKDRITPLSDAKIINKMIKQSKLYVIKDARHSPQYTHPEIVADRILGEIN